MTMTNDQRVAEILARGVNRLRATRIAVAGADDDATAEILEANVDAGLSDERLADESKCEEATR
jgi:hypothetical protein